MSEKFLLASNGLSIAFFAYIITALYTDLLELSMPIVIGMTFLSLTLRFIGRLMKIREKMPEIENKFSKKKKE